MTLRIKKKKRTVRTPHPVGSHVWTVDYHDRTASNSGGRLLGYFSSLRTANIAMKAHASEQIRQGYDHAYFSVSYSHKGFAKGMSVRIDGELVTVPV